MAPVEHPDEKDALWNLLGSATDVSASPFFASKVLRAIEKPSHLENVFSLLRRWLPVPAFAAIAIGMALSVAGYQQQRDRDVAAFNKQFDAITDIDSLTASDDASVLLTDIK